MVKLSDNVKLILLTGIAVALLITVSVLIADANNDKGLGTSFCENFTISDDQVRQIFANGFVGNGILSVTNSELRCLPEQVFDKLSDEDIAKLETSSNFLISIRAPLVAVHPDAFKTDLDLGRVTNFNLHDEPDGTIVETGDNLLAPFTNLLGVILSTFSTSISDTLVGEVTTIRRVDIFNNPNLTLVPTFVSNQLFLEDISFADTAISEIQNGLFSGLERLHLSSINVDETPLARIELTESDVADFYGTGRNNFRFERFQRDHCDNLEFGSTDELNDQIIRRRMRDNIHFNSDTNTTVIDFIVDCFPNDLFRQFSDEELFSLFPQDRDTSFLITSPLDAVINRGENIFIAPEGLFDRVTSVTFQGSEFFSGNTVLEENMFQRFIALEEIIFREVDSFSITNILTFDLIGDPCRNVTKTFRVLNTLGFVSFPRILSFCPLIERIDFTGCLNFVGNQAQLLDNLENLNELILTRSALDIEQEGNKTAIAEILQVPEDIIVIID